MAKYATKAKENIFTQARYNAAKFNDRLNSREGASEELGIDRSRLARIELGSKNPFPDEVLMMSDIYNAPELKAHFCKYMCPLGKDFPEVESEDLDRISVKALSSFRKISKAKDLLLDITEDGIITDEEKGDLEIIPYWCLPDEYPFKYQIERIVPMYPFGQDKTKYDRLINVLALYRLTLGQPRQEEMIAILQREDLSKEQMEELFFDLSPYSRNKKKQTLQW